MNLGFLTYTMKSKIFAGIRRLFLSITFLFTPIQLAQFLHWKLFKSKRPNAAEPVRNSASNLNMVSQKESIPKVAIILHVFYPDIGIEILHQVLPKSNHFDKILITHSMTTAVLKEFQSEVPQELLSKCHFMTIENRFRDCGPFIQAAASPYLSDCTVFLKLHTKKSPHLPNDEGSFWRRDLIDGLLNPKDVENLIKQLATQSEPLWACPERWISTKSDWGFNSFQVWKLTRLLNIRFRGRQPFPVGNMYWLNCLILNDFKSLTPDITPGSVLRLVFLKDGNWIHGFERIPSCYEAVRDYSV
jgi:lipopolysaccharide biosynthesis protein